MPSRRALGGGTSPGKIFEGRRYFEIAASRGRHDAKHDACTSLSPALSYGSMIIISSIFNILFDDGHFSSKDMFTQTQ